MRFYRDLLQAAGLAGSSKEVSAVLGGISVVVGVLIWSATSVTGLAICIAVLALAAGIEALRIRASSRQASFERVWPQVFDTFQNAALSGISMSEQLEYLAESGPVQLRHQFAQLGRDLDLGVDIQESLERFKRSIGSRHADFLALLLELSAELGGHGMSETWDQASRELREEQALLGQVLAKQGWVSGSAKIALIAPWLIALILIQLPQNKSAFATELGALVLLFGLLLSVVAYALVNKLGALTLPGRIFHGA